MADGRWLTRDYVYAALSRAVVLELCGVGSDGEADAATLENLIQRAETHVESFALNAFSGGASGLSASSPLYKAAALEFFAAFACDRHPEVQRENGDRHYARGVAIMKRVQSAEQRPVDAPRPATTGSSAGSEGAKLITDGSDGTSNAGDF